MWCLGCLLAEFITRRPIFLVESLGDDDENNDDHFFQCFGILGSIPPKILSSWYRSSIYFGSSGETIGSYIGDFPTNFDISSLPNQPSLEPFFDEYKPADIIVEDSKSCKHILKWILQYDAAKRPSIREFLADL